MNKYYKFYSVEYDTEHENVTIYISMDGEHLRYRRRFLTIKQGFYRRYIW